MVRRFAKDQPCPVCGGYDRMPRGRGDRCYGFLSDDGRYAHCTREERAGGLPMEASNTYAHRIEGECRCNGMHAATPARTVAKRIVASYPFTDAQGKLLFEEVRYDPKDFAMRRPDGNGGWVWNLDGVERVLYNLPSLISVVAAAVKRPDDPGWTVYVVEGPKDADALNALGLCATTNPQGAGKWRDPYAECFSGGRVVIIADKDPGENAKKPMGRAHAQDIARSCHGKARSVKVLLLPGEHIKDASDWLSSGGTREQLEALAEAAPEWSGRWDVGEFGASSGHAIDPAKLLDDVEAFIRRYVVFTNGGHKAIAVVLWAAHTFALDHCEQSPLLAITSPTMRSGKTRLFDTLELVVHRPWRAILPSDAVVFRYVAERRPTLLLDEADAIFGKNAGEYEGLRALLNAGNRRGTSVPRLVAVGKKFKLEEFSVYCPKAIAGIGALPATLADRAIPIRMERRLKRETIARFRRADADAEAEPLRRALESWMTNLDLSAARTDVPQQLDDRAAEGWEPLLAIADAAGGKWPERARAAAIKLHASRDTDEEALTLVLLRDLRAIFAERGVDRMGTVALLADLNALEASPWGDLRGRPLNSHGLSKLLRPYGIEPRAMRIEGAVKNGYSLEQLADAFGRYLASPEEAPNSPTSQQPAEGLTEMERAARDSGLAA